MRRCRREKCGSSFARSIIDFLEVRVRAAREAADLATYAELAVRDRFARGRIEVVVRCDGLASSHPVLDRARARAVYADLRALRDEVAPNEPVPMVLLSMVPDLFVVPEVPSDVVKRAFDGAFEAAARALDAMREKEGAALAVEMRDHLARVIACVDAIEKRAPEALVAAQKRLRERIERLASSPEAAIDPIRLEQEIAVLADRSDVAEEIARLRSHIDAARRPLRPTGPHRTSPRFSPPGDGARSKYRGREERRRRHRARSRGFQSGRGANARASAERRIKMIYARESP